MGRRNRPWSQAVARRGACLEAERRAQQFFAEVKATATDPALRALAQEMALEEAGHIAMVEQALANTPDAQVDWATIFGD